QQTEGRVTHFVSMLGTSGTFVGTTRRLKELNPNVRCISLQPDSPFHGIEGAKHMATAIVPKIYDAKLADEDLGIATEDAYKMAIRLAREEGLLVGISAAAAVVGCLKVAAQRKKGQQAGMATFGWSRRPPAAATPARIRPRTAITSIPRSSFASNAKRASETRTSSASITPIPIIRRSGRRPTSRRRTGSAALTSLRVLPKA